ncbi:serine hydrolase domain-containing protein [Brevundimonas sp. TWP2-3-2]|uniref:serine hydrolase domain-containing protein n=1 Tax=unclassified Brevundimonas TaxID=2622653 RepID=UPI003CEF5E93
MIVRGLLASSICLFATSASAEPIGPLVTAAFKSAHIPGGVVALVSSSGPIEVATFGVCPGGTPITSDRPFLIGSLSKSVTAAVATRLASQGRLTLDAPLRTLEPSSGGSAATTARQLLNQTSGFSRRQGFSIPSPDTAGFSNLQPVGSPGAYAYSNLNYVVLGQEIESRSGAAFEAVVAREVFDPLAMSSTAAIVPDRCGHRLFFGLVTPWAEEPVPGHLAPAGFIRASAPDVGKFMTAILAQTRSGKDEGWPSLNLNDNDPVAYHQGWRTAMDQGERIWWHSGSTGSYRATMVMLPSRDRAFVILTNLGGHNVDDPVDDLGQALIAHVRGQPSQPPATPLEPWARMALLLVVAWSLMALFFTTRRWVKRDRALSVGTASMALAAAPWIAAGVLSVFALQHFTGLSLLGIWRLAPDIGLTAAVVLATGAVRSVMNRSAPKASKSERPFAPQQT